MQIKINLLLCFFCIHFLCARTLPDIPELPENPSKSQVRAVLDTLETRIYKDF